MNQKVEWKIDPETNNHRFFILDKEIATVVHEDDLYHAYTYSGEYMLETLEEAKHMAELTAYVVPNQYYNRH